MQLAKIENGIVINLILADELLEGYVKADPAMRIGLSWPLPAPNAQDVANAHAAKLTEIVNGAEDAINALPGAEKYGHGERTTWPTQVKEAEALKLSIDTGSATPSTPMLSAMVARSGEDIAALATEILANETAWSEASGSIIGIRQALTKGLADAANISDPATALTAIAGIEVVYA